MTFNDVHRLIKKGDIAGMRHALDGGLDVNLLNRFSWLLLMLAAGEGNVGLGRLLVSRGARIEQTNDAGETALSLAAQQGHPRFVQLLLRAGLATPKDRCCVPLAESPELVSSGKNPINPHSRAAHGGARARPSPHHVA
jgi:ankyrin repeat protein